MISLLFVSLLFVCIKQKMNLKKYEFLIILVVYHASLPRFYFCYPGSFTFPEVDPDPAKSSWPGWIRIHNTFFTCPWTQLRLVSSEFHLIPWGNSNLKQYKNINFPDNINFKDNITIINIPLHYYITGVYIKFEINIFSPKLIYYNVVMRAAAEKF